MRKKTLFFMTAFVLIISFGAIAPQSHATTENEVEVWNLTKDEFCDTL